MWLESMISYLPDYHILATRYLDFFEIFRPMHLFGTTCLSSFLKNSLQHIY